MLDGVLSKNKNETYSADPATLHITQLSGVVREYSYSIIFGVFLRLLVRGESSASEREKVLLVQPTAVLRTSYSDPEAEV